MEIENKSKIHRKRVRTYNIPGHVHFLTFSCYKRAPLLTNETWRKILGDSVRQNCNEMNFSLWAYVFMPEHIHLLVKPDYEKYDVAVFRKRIKQSAATTIISSLKEVNSPILNKLRVEKDGECCEFRFWQRGPGYDTNIWNISKAQEKATYCHNNPITRKLVKSPDQWKWSSFRWLEMNKRDKEPLFVNEWTETYIKEDGTLGGIGNPGLEFDPEQLKRWN